MVYQGCCPGLSHSTTMTSLPVSHLGGPQSCISAMEPRRARVRRWSVNLFFIGCCGGARGIWWALALSSEMFCYLLSFVMSVLTWIIVWSLWYEWDAYYHAQIKAFPFLYRWLKVFFKTIIGNIHAGERVTTSLFQSNCNLFTNVLGLFILARVDTTKVFARISL